jgi:hypothetical protein
MNSVDTPWAMIVDVEQWDIPFIYWAWANRERYDVFLGSKRADPTLNRQSFYRNLLSWGLNSLIQLLFVFPGQDTHGPKLLRMGVIGDLLPLCMSERGQYDTEIVLRALGAGARLVEAPIGYIETRPPRNLMVSKIFFNIIGFVKIYIQLRSLPIKGPLQFHRFSRDDILAKCLPIDFVNSGGDLHRNKP